MGKHFNWKNSAHNILSRSYISDIKILNQKRCSVWTVQLEVIFIAVFIFTLGTYTCPLWFRSYAWAYLLSSLWMLMYLMSNFGLKTRLVCAAALSVESSLSLAYVSFVCLVSELWVCLGLDKYSISSHVRCKSLNTWFHLFDNWCRHQVLAMQSLTDDTQIAAYSNGRDLQLGTSFCCGSIHSQQKM